MLANISVQCAPRGGWSASAKVKSQLPFYFLVEHAYPGSAHCQISAKISKHSYLCFIPFPSKNKQPFTCVSISPLGTDHHGRGITVSCGKSEGFFFLWKKNGRLKNCTIRNLAEIWRGAPMQSATRFPLKKTGGAEPKFENCECRPPSGAVSTLSECKVKWSKSEA
jgi:hypothetical protein